MAAPRGDRGAVDLGQHVDDVCQSATGQCDEAVLQKLAPAAVAAARPEKKQLGLMAFFSKKVA